MAATAMAQETAKDTLEPAAKTTSSGFAVTLRQAKPGERWPNGLPDSGKFRHRFGTCPPGAIQPEVFFTAERNQEVFVVHLGIKVLPAYKDMDLSNPELVDSNGKVYHPPNTFKSTSSKLFRKLQETGEELLCEFSFVVPSGTKPSKLNYEDVTFAISGK